MKLWGVRGREGQIGENKERRRGLGDVIWRGKGKGNKKK